MRIAILCQFEEYTATGIHLLGKARALASLDQDVILIFHPFKYKSKLINQTRNVQKNFCLYTFYSTFFGDGKVKWLGLPKLLLWDVPRVYRLLAQSDAVILNKPLPLSWFYQGLLGILGYRGKTICSLDDWEGIGGIASIRTPEKIMRKLLVTAAEEYMPVWADGNICASRLLVEKLEMSRRSRGKTIYVPLGASADWLEMGSQIETGSHGFLVGYVGTFKSVFLIRFLVKVMAETLKMDDSVNFILMGGGSKWEELAELVSQLELKENIHLTGQIPHAKVLEELQRINLCLIYLNDQFPENYSDASRSSTKMFEYMALGKPILASRFGEPAEILRNGETGWLAENDPKVFARMILYAKTNPDECQKLRSKIRNEFSINYSHEALMAKFLKWIESR